MTITGDPPVEVQANADAEDRLTRTTRTMRVRPGIPVDRWLQIAGAALPLIGLVLIAAGWYGVSHTAREWRQTPYLVSGGVLGLAFVFLGGFTYFAYWLTKLVEQEHRQTQVLERIEAALTGRSVADAAAADVLVSSGGVAHRGDCALLAGRTDLLPIEPDAGLPACPVCEPELAEAPAASKSTSSRSRRRRSS